MAGGANNPMKRDENKMVQRQQISPSLKMRGLQLSQPETGCLCEGSRIELFKEVEAQREGH